MNSPEVISIPDDAFFALGRKLASAATALGLAQSFDAQAANLVLANWGVFPASSFEGGGEQEAREGHHVTFVNMMPSPQIVPAAAVLPLASFLADAQRSERALAIRTDVGSVTALSKQELSELAGYTLDEIIDGLDHVG